MKKYLTLIAASTGTLVARAASAQASQYFKPPSNSGLPETSIVDTVLNIISTTLSVLGIVALVLVMYGGFEILTSAGNSEKIDRGRRVLIWAGVGMIIILSSLGIVLFIDNTLS